MKSFVEFYLPLEKKQNVTFLFSIYLHRYILLTNKSDIKNSVDTQTNVCFKWFTAVIGNYMLSDNVLKKGKYVSMFFHKISWKVKKFSWAPS